MTRRHRSQHTAQAQKVRHRRKILQQQAENAAEETEMAAAAADMPEGAVAEVTADADGAVTGNLQAAQNNDSMDEKQRSQPAVSGNEASGAEDSMEEVEQDQEETLIEKQKSPSLEKMKTKGQQ